VAQGGEQVRGKEKRRRKAFTGRGTATELGPKKWAKCRVRVEQNYMGKGCAARKIETTRGGGQFREGHAFAQDRGTKEIRERGWFRTDVVGELKNKKPQFPRRRSWKGKIQGWESPKNPIVNRLKGQLIGFLCFLSRSDFGPESALNGRNRVTTHGRGA